MTASGSCGAVLGAARSFFSARDQDPSRRTVRFVQVILRQVHAHSSRSLPLPWKAALRAEVLLCASNSLEGSSVQLNADVIRTPQLKVFRAD